MKKKRLPILQKKKEKGPCTFHKQKLPPVHDSKTPSMQVCFRKLISSISIPIKTFKFEKRRLTRFEYRTEEEEGVLVLSLIDAVNQIASIGDYRCSVKEYCNLAKRLKLSTPMFEEIKESKEKIPEEILKVWSC